MIELVRVHVDIYGDNIIGCKAQHGVKLVQLVDSLDEAANRIELDWNKFRKARH